jgi:hypothetical protein
MEGFKIEEGMSGRDCILDLTKLIGREITEDRFGPANISWS